MNLSQCGNRRWRNDDMGQQRRFGDSGRMFALTPIATVWLRCGDHAAARQFRGRIYLRAIGGASIILNHKRK